MILQNGIGIENEYESLYPLNTIISYVVNLHATQYSLVVVQIGFSQLLELGVSESYSLYKRATTFSSLILRGGGKVNVFQNIQPRRQRKLLINASQNPIYTLTRLDNATVLRSCLEAIVYIRRLISEIINVIYSLGHYLVSQADTKELLNTIINRLSICGYKPSMSLDVRRRRPIEIEAILGNTI